MMTHKRLILILLPTLSCLFYQAPSYSGVYKWIDENGQSHYSDQPNGENAEKINILNNTTTKPRIIKKDKTKDNNTDTTPTEAVKPKEEKIPTAEKRKLCNEAKNDVAAISNRGRLREINAKGEYIYLSEKQRQQRISTAKKKQKKYCR